MGTSVVRYSSTLSRQLVAEPPESIKLSFKEGSLIAFFASNGDVSGGA